MDIQRIENTINYIFNNKDLLQQAFVLRSYSEENGGQNNQVLEFIGDKALDFAVIRLMMNRFGRITTDKQWSELKLTNPKYFKTKFDEGKFTDIKKMLVQKKALSKCMDKLGFNNQLIMGKGDIKLGVEDTDSVKEDLFEAIVGAVAVDSDYNMDVITDVVDTMLDLDDFFDNSGDISRKDDNFVGLLQEWAQRHGYGLPNYEYPRTYRDGFVCEVSIQGGDGFHHESYGEGESQAKARANAAYNAYNELLESGCIKSEYEEAVGEPNLENALRQVNELYQKRLIEKPNYEFEKDLDDEGDPLWYCYLTINDYDKEVFNGSSYTKREAQREAAYELLCFLMGYEIG